MGFRIGILGCGNMGAALASGLAKLGKYELVLFDTDTETLASLSNKCRAKPVHSVEDLFAISDLVVLAIKPQIFNSQCSNWNLSQACTRLVISLMAGLSSQKIRESFAKDFTVVRTMPNLPLAVGEGVTAIEIDGIKEKILIQTEELFQSCGKTVRVMASQMDAVTGLSGSGPMYLFEFVEGLIQGGVKSGLARDTARVLAEQTLRGALKLLENGEHPSSWSAKVCSPGGTTIHALHVLENLAFKATLISAVEAATNRSKALGT